jgi:CubicO group peptidase (beta-lactamase class C family)
MKQPYKLVSIFALLLIFSCKSEPQESTFKEKFELANPFDVGMIADSLAKIEPMIMDFVNAGKYPGAVTLIAKNGKIIYESAVGWSDSSRTIPYRKDHLFRMASMTKPLTSVAAMQLIEDGKLNLDDPVGKYIPTFNNVQVLESFNATDTTWTSTSANRTPTVRHLLTHTAGIPYSFTNPQVAGLILAKNNIPDLTTYLPITIEETASQLGNLPLIHQPGEKWMYGLNTDVLGRVIEVASGQKLDDYIQEHITDPLEIDRLAFFFNDSLTKDLTHIFLPTPDGKITQAPAVMSKMYMQNYPTEGAKTYLSGGSGMTGTARSYFLFCQAMLNNGSLNGKRILKVETAKSMHQNQIDTITYSRGKTKFGFGFDVAKDHPQRPDGTYSWSGAFSTVFWIDPVNELIVIQLRQVLSSPHNYEINSKLEKIVYGALSPTN